MVVSPDIVTVLQPAKQRDAARFEIMLVEPALKVCETWRIVDESADRLLVDSRHNPCKRRHEDVFGVSPDKLNIRDLSAALMSSQSAVS